MRSGSLLRRPVMYLMLSTLAAMTDTPAPGNVTLEVEAYSKTMSGLPASRHRVMMSAKGTNSPSNSWMQ